MIRFLLITASAGLFTACTKDYDVDLPPYESKLVVECYLEAGRPPMLTLTESSPYFAPPAIPTVAGATVVLSYAGRTDTLVNGVFTDASRGRVYNYGSTRALPQQPRGDFRLTATDAKGRRIEAVTRFMPVVPITSLEPLFNDVKEAFCLTKFPDDPTQQNYYQLVLNKGRANTVTYLSSTLDDNFANDKNDIIFGSGYDFVEGDTIVATVYHLESIYYKFLSTSDNADAGSFNPFAVSGEIISNVQGGLGIVTTLSYDRKTVVVPAPGGTGTPTSTR